MMRNYVPSYSHGNNSQWTAVRAYQDQAAHRMDRGESPDRGSPVGRADQPAGSAQPSNQALLNAFAHRIRQQAPNDAASTVNAFAHQVISPSSQATSSAPVPVMARQFVTVEDLRQAFAELGFMAPRSLHVDDTTALNRLYRVRMRPATFLSALRIAHSLSPSSSALVNTESSPIKKVIQDLFGVLLEQGWPNYVHEAACQSPDKPTRFIADVCRHRPD